jgi:hypothetical protein
MLHCQTSVAEKFAKTALAVQRLNRGAFVVHQRVPARLEIAEEVAIERANMRVSRRGTSGCGNSKGTLQVNIQTETIKDGVLREAGSNHLVAKGSFLARCLDPFSGIQLDRLMHVPVFRSEVQTTRRHQSIVARIELDLDRMFRAFQEFALHVHASLIVTIMDHTQGWKTLQGSHHT